MKPTNCKSPLRDIFIRSLLPGFLVLSISAQTRLDTSQVAPLKGGVQGPFSGTKLRDLNSAVDHGDGKTNAVASAIADCGVTVSCSILIPPTYGAAEQVPGYALDYSVPSAAAAMAGNIAVFDRRYSDARMSVNNNGFEWGLINAPSGWLYNYYSKAPQNAYLASFYLRQWSLDGGNNQKSASLSYADKTTWAGSLVNGISHTPGQHVNMTIGGQNTSLGDYTTIRNLVTCYGGYYTEGDLGCHAVDNYVVQGNVEYSGVLTGTPSTGTLSVSVSPTQGRYTQGAGRFLVKTNAGTINSGTISQVSTPYNSAAVVTVTGTTWPASTVTAQLGTDLAIPGTATVTPSNFSVGSIAGLQTSALVCVSDNESFEMLQPTAVTATTFTANFAKIHPSNAVISVGGLCGYVLDLTADDVTDSTFPSKTQTITGTLHFAWPVISSTTGTASLWVIGDGGWQQMVSRWNASTANGYVLYPFAEVTSTQQSGTLSDNLTLGPNNVPWSAGDVVSEFLYPATHLLFGNTVVESFYPNMPGADQFSLQYNMPLQGNEAMLSLLNNGPKSFYNSQGGRYGSPSAVHIAGATSQAFTADLPAEKATIGIGCAAPCNSNLGLMAAANGTYYDLLFYDQANKHWYISANSNATHYTFDAGQFSVPFANVWMSNDSGQKGYVATQQVRSNVSTNSDMAGELVFSNASTATQNLQGSYSNHPECWVSPGFDLGATNRHWVTYTGGAFTVNFASPVTGTVAYSCMARN